MRRLPEHAGEIVRRQLHGSARLLQLERELHEAVVDALVQDEFVLHAGLAQPFDKNLLKI